MLNNFSLKSYLAAISFLMTFVVVTGQAQEAKKICVEDNYDALIVEANRGIKFSPYNIQAYLKRGYAYMRKIEYDKALADFNRVLEIHPKSETALLYRATLYAVRANYNQAINDFTAAIEINPENAETFYMRGRVYVYKSENNLAVNDFNRAITLEKDFAYAYYGRGAQYQLEGKKSEAIKDYNSAIEILGKYIELSSTDCSDDLFLARGIIYQVLKNNRQAMNDFDKSIAIKKNETAYYYRGQSYFYNKNYAAAIADFTKAIELNSQFAESYKERAVAFEKLKETEKAESDRQKYKELSGKR